MLTIGVEAMPLERCTHDGKDGWKVRNGNKCFVGPNSRQKALEQLRAIEISKHKPKAEQNNILRKVVEAVISGEKDE